MQTIHVRIEAAAAGLKIDKALLASGVSLSRNEIRRILDKGGIHCNGRRIFIASYTVKKGDQITLNVHTALSKKAPEQHAALTMKDIVYWDDDLLAVNKAPGIASVPTVSGRAPFVKKLLAPLMMQKAIKPESLIECHRLDKETSGVLALALTNEKATWLMEQFKNRQVQKTYYALCYNIPREPTWEMKCFLSSIHKKTGMVSIVKSGGHASMSSFQLIASSRKHNISLVRIEPKTGRSHQIRVHLLHSKTPIIGDKRYVLPGQKILSAPLMDLTFEHHFLHAAALSFNSALNGERIQISASLPPLFRSFIHKSQMEFHIQDPLLAKIL